jgi:hypothetical protein
MTARAAPACASGRRSAIWTSCSGASASPAPGSALREDERPLAYFSALPMTLPIAAMDPLFSGDRSASFLRRAGRLTGDDRAIALADLVFAVPKSWLAAHF